MPEKIITTIKNNIAFITLNHSEKSNAIGIEMRDALINAYHELQKNTDIKIIVLNANGKHFCAGADLQHMIDMGNAPFEKNVADAKQLADLFYTIYHCTKTTVCYAFGKIMGGGLGLLAANDISIAAHDATFCFSEIKLGLIPAVISPFILQRIHYQTAKYFMMTADVFDAQKALEIKLIDRIDHDATALTNILLPYSSRAMEHMKKWLHELHPISAAQINKAAELLASMRSHDDTKKMIANYLQSRKLT